MRGMIRALPGELAQGIKALQAELHDRDGWRTPFADGDPLRIFVARKEAGGVRRLSARSLERGRLVGPSIQIDGSAMSDGEIVSEAARLYALATLSAYGAPDRTFLTAAAADYLSAGVRLEQDSEKAFLAAAAPTLDLGVQSDALGRFYVEEFARAAGGAFALRTVWEKAAETGQEILPLFLAAYSESTGKAEDQLLLRFAARLYSSMEPEAGPSRIGLFDLQTGALDASNPSAFVLRHRSYLPGADAPSALRLSWPETGAPAAAVVRYRDAALPPDVIFLTSGAVAAIPLAGVARIDWLVAGCLRPRRPGCHARVLREPVGIPLQRPRRACLRGPRRSARLVDDSVARAPGGLGDLPRRGPGGWPHRADGPGGPSGVRPWR